MTRISCIYLYKKHRIHSGLCQSHSAWSAVTPLDFHGTHMMVHSWSKLFQLNQTLCFLSLGQKKSLGFFSYQCKYMAQKQHLYYFYDQFSKEKRVSIKFQQNTTYSDPTFWLKNRSVFSISLFFFNEIFSDLSVATMRRTNVILRLMHVSVKGKPVIFCRINPCERSNIKRR